MKRIEMNEAAEREFVDILAYHDKTWHWLGRNLFREFQELFRAIQASPERFQPYRKGFRFAMLPQSPFVVYFEELNDRIWISSVNHGRRKPGYWMRRKPPEQ